ncbi:DUF4430 domain-containing protein [Olsenella sp. An293]|uniref:DUF4430 domain-containing protein n=1 Tax=Olsenella sp. An293 TaxID=1965626 RepID=UPI000B38EAD6|nr:DUF4430 domain-containing protein [Olsenella sp. An293]OUO32517.1 hypothetical protein B5F85_05895 [Olsenella sp. An293]
MSQHNLAKKNRTEKSLLTRLVAGAAAFALALAVAACGGTPAATGDDATADVGQEQQATVAVSVTIDATAGEGESTTVDVDVPEGSTVYDALVATGADVNASDSDYGMYVAGINGLAGGDFGDMSGWMFEVNGEMAEVGCSQLEVADGDAITWTYVTEFTE